MILHGAEQDVAQVIAGGFTLFGACLAWQRLDQVSRVRALRTWLQRASASAG